jgi:hypothetical protein
MRSDFRYEPRFTNMKNVPTEIKTSTATRHTLMGQQLSHPPSFQKFPCHSYIRILELGQHQLTLSTKLTCCRNVSDSKNTMSPCKHWTYNQECPCLVRNLITEQCAHFAKSITMTENLYRMCYHPNHRRATMLARGWVHLRNTSLHVTACTHSPAVIYVLKIY